MALPAPIGTELHYSTDVGQSEPTWTAFGCVSSIEYKEEGRSTDVDLINNAITTWSGVVLTSKTRVVTINGLFKNNAQTAQIVSDVGAALMAGSRCYLKLSFKDANDITQTYTFTKQEGSVSPLVFVVTDREINIGAGAPATFTITFGVDSAQ